MIQDIFEQRRNTLPPYFKTWRDFYIYMEREGHINGKQVLEYNILADPHDTFHKEIHDRINGSKIVDAPFSDSPAQYRWSINVDFLKARLFEEIWENLPNTIEMHQLYFVLKGAPAAYDPEIMKTMQKLLVIAKQQL